MIVDDLSFSLENFPFFQVAIDVKKKQKLVKVGNFSLLCTTPSRVQV